MPLHVRSSLFFPLCLARCTFRGSESRPSLVRGRSRGLFHWCRIRGWWTLQAWWRNGCLAATTLSRGEKSACDIYIHIYIIYRSFLNPRWSTSRFVMLGAIGLRGFKNRLLLKDTKFSLRSCGFFCNSWDTFWNQQFFEKIEDAWTSCLEHLEIYWIVLCRNTFRDFPKLLMFWSSIWPSAQKWTSKALESAFEITASVALNSVLLYSVGRRSAHVLICIFWVIFRLETTRGTFP